MLPSIVFFIMESMSILEFIEYTKKNPDKFICYCEIMITPTGSIILCRPSHQETVLKYVMEKENKTREELSNSIPMWCSPLSFLIDKYGLIAVWYDFYIGSKCHGVNRFQKRTIDLLTKNGLVDFTEHNLTNEYGLYLEREKLLKES